MEVVPFPCKEEHCSRWESSECGELARSRNSLSLPMTLSMNNIQKHHFRHGDLLYVSYDRSQELQEPTVPTTSMDALSATTTTTTPSFPLDAVDVALEKQDGLIRRKKDANLWVHRCGSNSLMSLVAADMDPMPCATTACPWRWVGLCISF